MATKYIKIIFKIWMNQNAILHILAYLPMLFWKRLAVCSTIPFHLPGHTTITTFLSLSWNSGRAMQLVLAKKSVAYTPCPCSFTGSPPTDQLDEDGARGTLWGDSRGWWTTRWKEPRSLSPLAWRCVTRNISNGLDHENKRNMYYVKA